MKKLVIMFIVALCNIAADAQICDLTYIFHVGQEPRHGSLIICHGERKDTYWMGNPEDIYTFDDDGNLKSHNDKPYTDFVRDEEGVLKEVTCDDTRYKLEFLTSKIVIEASTNDSFYYRDEYFLNKEGYVAKKVRTYWDNDKVTKTYSYVDKSGGDWYIRKVKSVSESDKSTYYQCLKKFLY